LVKTLQFKNKELQDIVYTASHDLRSPLVNIQGFSGELAADCGHLTELLRDADGVASNRDTIENLLGEEIPQSLGFISGSAKKMSCLLDGLLQVSRVGTVKIISEPVDMNEKMSEVLSAAEYMVKENYIAVTVDQLPGCTGDKNMLDHVFTNLVGNAIKYLDPARKGEVHISGKVVDDKSVYCVEDNGVGIAPGHQEKVFEIFHRLDPEGSVGGEGLGLTIVMRIVDRMGGEIWVESEVGKGSKFFVSLPK
jgi:chemotaxis family two-component system sensor kinase Cph1